jgi:hypothetical protein
MDQETVEEEVGQFEVPEREPETLSERFALAEAARYIAEATDLAARAGGLLQKVCPPGECLDRVRELARGLSQERDTLKEHVANLDREESERWAEAQRKQDELDRRLRESVPELAALFWDDAGNRFDNYIDWSEAETRVEAMARDFFARNPQLCSDRDLDPDEVARMVAWREQGPAHEARLAFIRGCIATADSDALRKEYEHTLEYLQREEKATA